ncbi:DUF4906 domain-containing protein [Parabacteroides distasonis]|uniref:DUF4906 domain-containing protein n=1 Tax=Parabacteroides distasonis TaxID=823 RepID=UPI001F41A5FC|nr:DUF4906 domain-containing protein [Parabacteroides distasonis]MCE9042438.1 DUF4906 domain-containing protein [Parabacteroides distasonis]
MKKILYYFLPVAAMLLPAACTTEEDFGGNTVPHGDGFTIEAVCQNMLPQQVATRSAIAKDEDEKRINQLYLFFFDKDGNYLESNNKDVFFPYMAPAQNTTNVSVPTDVFKDPSKAKYAIIYALANVAPEVIADNDNDGYPDNFPYGGKNGKTPKDLFDEFVYDPVSYTSGTHDDITALPSTGMPMVGRTKTTVKLTEKGNLTMQLKALMARIDINISIDSDHSDESGRLPRLSIAEWGVHNMPTAVPLTEPDNGLTKLTTADPYRDATGIQSNAVVYNHGEAATITFYMFENMIAPDTDPEEYEYPAGVVEDVDKQRWKPELVNEDSKATYFTMKAYYTTYNGDPSLPAGQDNTTIEAEYTFYLGKDAVKDFKVMRNRHYANNVVISGLTRVGNNPNHITFDARVNITEQNNPFYLSMLRERDHDAHFCVTPLDVYLFEEDANPQMTVSIEDPENHIWVRMERVPAENMREGTLPANMSEEKYLATGKKDGKEWTAGNGKRRYFTTDLVTNELAKNTLYTITTSRDRIYFYLDENLSTKDRTATVNIEYTDDNTQTPRTRTIEIVQHGLLPVQWYNEGKLQGTIYVEAYEEYISHYDPLNEFEGDYIYDGLEWGCDGITLAFSEINDEWTLGSKHGAEATQRIISRAGQSTMTLNDKPRSAAEYCYNKNKRDARGLVQNMSNSSGWFLPGISQLESILTTYYNNYPEFQNNFYWSSAAAKRRILGGLDYYEDNKYARATKALSGGGYAESDWDDIYTSENGTTGKAPRTGTFLRIRAAYVPPSGVTIE